MFRVNTHVLLKIKKKYIYYKKKCRPKWPPEKWNVSEEWLLIAISTEEPGEQGFDL